MWKFLEVHLFLNYFFLKYLPSAFFVHAANSELAFLIITDLLHLLERDEP